MSDVVSLACELSIKSGQFDSFKAPVEEAVQVTRKEPNTLAYEWFLSEDNSNCQVYARYADSAATMAHIGTLSEIKYVERLRGVVDIMRITAFGAPNDDLKGVLAGFGVTVMGQLNGFSR